MKNRFLLQDFLPPFSTGSHSLFILLTSLKYLSEGYLARRIEKIIFESLIIESGKRSFITHAAASDLRVLLPVQRPSHILLVGSRGYIYCTGPRYSLH